VSISTLTPEPESPELDVDVEAAASTTATLAPDAPAAAPSVCIASEAALRCSAALSNPLAAAAWGDDSSISQREAIA